jgi:hypothetical protein
MGLTSSLVERFQERRCDYPTYGWAHKGGGTHIDHVFRSLPPEVLLAGGTPSNLVWGSVSYHLPVCASFYIPEIRETARRGRKRTYKVNPNPSFCIKDKKDGEKKKVAFEVEWVPRNYPAALIHGKTGGSGVKSFSQLHREGAERIITRCMDGPEPGKSAARGIANRAFRTQEKEDLALGQETAVTHTPRVDTYMQPLLGHAAKKGDLWHRRAAEGTGGHAGAHLYGNAEPACQEQTHAILCLDAKPRYSVHYRTR